MERVTVTAKPPSSVVTLTALFVLIATLPLALVPIAFGVGVTGGTLGIVGTAIGSRRVLGVGVLAILLGGLLAGAQGLPVPGLGMSIVGALLVWDAGEQSVSVAGQVGQAGDPERPIVVHVAVTVVGAVVVGSAVYLVYAVASGGQPVVALVLLLIGATFIISSLRL